MSKFAVLIVAGLLTSLSAFSQDTTQPATTPRPRHNHAQPDRSEQKLKRLTKKLGLTDEQKEKLRPILQDEDKQMSSLDSDTALTAQQKHKKMREIRMASKAQMDDILTPEQKEKMPKMHSGSGEHHHRKSGTATPSADPTTTPQ
jgi:Spy/CpxP family protein refolding chaperone